MEEQRIEKQQEGQEVEEGRYSLNNLYIYITDRCNERCRHCWITPKYLEGRLEPDIPIDRFIAFIEQARPLDFSYVKLTGGEPLLREDIGDLLLYLAENELSIGMETNGTLITEEKATLLKKLNVDVSISLDAADPQVHDHLRGVSGAHEGALRGIRLLREQEMKVKTIMSLYRPNLHQLEPTVKLCQELSVRSVKINPITQMGRAAKMEEGAVLLTASELLRLNRETVPELQKRYGISVDLDLPCGGYGSLRAIRTGKMGTCPFLNLLGVLAHGDITFCGWGYSNPDWIMGNILDPDLDLTDLWEKHSLLQEARSKLPEELEGVCGSCIMRKGCLGKCRAHALAKYGSITSPDPKCQELYEAGLFPTTRLVDTYRSAAAAG